MDALSAWRAAALTEVELPSGIAAHISIPGVEDLIRGGQLPQELRDTALRFATSGVDLGKLDLDDLEKYLAFQDQLVASMVAELRFDESAEWQPVSLSPEELVGIPGQDRDALSLIATRRATPATITARSRRDRGLLEASEAVRIARREEPATVDGWRSFRGERGGAVPGEGGRAVADTSEPPAGNQ